LKEPNRQIAENLSYRERPRIPTARGLNHMPGQDVLELMRANAFRHEQFRVAPDMSPERRAPTDIQFEEKSTGGGDHHPVTQLSRERHNVLVPCADGFD
jgi:hypothetical protein